MRNGLAVAVFLLALPSLAQAAVVNGSFSATALDGQDTTGVFGAPNPDLTNAAIIGSYSIDTSLLTSSLMGTADTYTGSPGALSVTVTIGGQSYTFTDPTFSTILLDSGAGEFILQAANFTGGLESNIRLDMTFAAGVITDSADPTLSFAGTATPSSSGGFAILDGSVDRPTALAAADFAVITVANGVQPVPEPASLALVAAALGVAAVLRRRASAS